MNNKIIVKIRGGLGNQLFQYAYAKRINQLFPEKELLLDISYFKNKHIREIEINKLLLCSNLHFFTEKNIVYDIAYLLYRVIGRLLSCKHYPEKIKKIGKNIYIFCDKSISHTFIDKNINNIYLAGYFQQESDIRAIKGEIKNGIIPICGLTNIAKSYYSKIISSPNIAISVRLGSDYVKFGWPVCSKEYYRCGLKKILSEVNASAIFIFSDCIEIIKAENWFNDYDVIYVEDCSTVEGLFLLSCCDNYVIANSTFSWWGAYLSTNSKKRICAPKYFYSGEIMENGNLHLPHAIYLNNFDGK